MNYALGIVSGDYKGHKQFIHGGADAGYRTFLAVFPDLRMGFVVFSNLGDVNTGSKAYEVADLFISDTAKRKTGGPTIGDSSKAVIHDTTAIKKYLGSYIADDGFQANFRLQNQKAYADAYGQSFLLVRSEKDTFSVITDPSVKIVFQIGQPGDTTAYVSLSLSEKHLLKKYVSYATPTDAFLQAYTGDYYCPELGCSYGIVLKDHKLLLTNNKYDDTPLTVVGTEHLLDDFWWMSHLLMTRNEKKEITGFEVTGGRVMHLQFNKVK
jgi:hypothetical protein